MELMDIMKKMVEFGGYNPEEFNFDEEQWFHNNTWTKDQEQAFKEWLFSYLDESIKNRRQLMTVPKKTKKNYENFWSWFNLMYGLRREDYE